MKFQYPITVDYVRDWTIREAIRELVANGIDGEAQNGAAFTAKHDPKREILSLTNRGVTVDAKALYFGGTSKQGSVRYIGQYGEGLKIAMLVFARLGYKLLIRNGSEVWQPSIEPDKLGQEVLTVNIRKGSADNKDFKVEIHGVNSEAWAAIQDMFLALRAPTKVETASRGSVIFDADYVGKIFVKGVYCTARPNYSTGYNFVELDIGRDRRIPSTWDMDYETHQIWGELSSRNVDLGGALYKMMRNESAEAEAFRYASAGPVSKALLAEFHQEFGGDAYPTASVSEAAEFEHFGKKGVVLGAALAALLKRELPAKEQIQAQLKQEVTSRVQLHDLNAAERKVLVDGLKLGQKILNADPGKITSIVTFRDPLLRGLHKSGEIFISRGQLASLGKFVVTLVHEWSHEFGGDGEKSHVDQIQAAFERLVDIYGADAGAGG
jgi:hypothetical protein